eukprot:CAMPEP_0172487674 /NCGR_PEP_ID=MMETSP1066-20121228/16845_1 /TAXON_ID=671091 /ORGANISM="Coscinodiscus wailesii, Strain CCMP2513" /LENGTH=823 /DNA_ID=CAMNT_0013254429 /DNA_START=199 /DNA_END=2670 /DNA_ORIENTATION=+
MEEQTLLHVTDNQTSSRTPSPTTIKNLRRRKSKSKSLTNDDNDDTLRPSSSSSSERDRRRKKKNVTIRQPGDSSPTKKKKSKHKKKQKLFRPCSPASYPSPLPIREGVLFGDDSTTEEEDNAGTMTTTTTTDGLTSSNGGGGNNSRKKSPCPSFQKNTDGQSSLPEQTVEKRGSNGEDNDERRGHHEATTVKFSCPSESTKDGLDEQNIDESFMAFRIHYLIVHIAIMLADGLQGTHLYILYEGYGYTVASLYCLGFVSGAFTSPFIGPLVDKIGRRNSAVAYCVLEIGINMLEQYDIFAGLIMSRVVGGVTTNLLFTVFESWLVTEHRRRGFSEEKLETVLRDSVVASNFSAIASGCLAHILASKFGAKGPFEGAVACTFVALVLVATRWEENYGSDVPGVKSIRSYMSNAFTTIVSDSKICRIGIIQGLTEGALQTFVFLWSPTLHYFANKLKTSSAVDTVLGLDADGEPAYGLIFGAFMACGAFGGMMEPTIRRMFVNFIYRNNSANDVSEISSSSPEQLPEKEDNKNVVINHPSTLIENEVTSNIADSNSHSVSTSSDMTFEDDSLSSSRLPGVPEETDSHSYAESEDDDDKPVAVELLASLCFFTCAGLLATPVLVNEDSDYAFTASLVAFLIYEAIVGLYMPCEGVLRSIYMPNDSICSLMTMLRVIVNVAVALGVISTNYIPFSTAFAACSLSLIVAATLQLTLVNKSEWTQLMNVTIRRLPFYSAFTNSDLSNDLNSSALKLGHLNICSPVPEARRIDSNVSSPSSSVSSLPNDDETSDQRTVSQTCVEPMATLAEGAAPDVASEGIRRRRVLNN